MSHLLTSIDPANGHEIATYSIYTPEIVDEALANAVTCFATWRRRSFEERATVLLNIATKLRENKEHLARLATLEMGKPIQQGREEVEKCAGTLEYYANYGAAFMAPVHIPTDATRSYVTYQPLGAVLAIMPWNFPYWQVFRAMAPALMAGNVMLLKHASNVSGCALAIEEVIRKAGAPEGMFRTLLLPATQIAELIARPDIAGVTLTGSTQAGSKVAEVAGRYLKKTVLELGGSDAYLVLADADIEQAAEICVNGRLKNSGQSCVAAKRFVVMQEILPAFEQAMTRRMEQTTWGNPLKPENIVGPMARTDLRDQLHQQVQQSIALGARLLCGGYIPEGDGAYYPPTVLTNVTKGMPTYDEELFGPVAAIIAATNEAHGLQIANDSIYGLGAAIISSNTAHAEQLAAEQLEAGSCFVNDFVHSDTRLPFGGIKQSGYGRELGSFGMMEFVNVKTVYVK